MEAFSIVSEVIKSSGKRKKASVFFLLFLLLFLGAVGLLTPFSYNYFPALSLLELGVAACATLFFPPKRNALFFFSISFFYLVLTLLISFLDGVFLLDYIQAYKAFFYIAILSLFLGSGILSKKLISNFFYFLLALFFIKYFYSRVLSLDTWMSARPGIYTENNFELVFLLLVFYLAFDSLRFKFSSFFFVCAVIALSGSRSSLLCLFVVYFSMFFKFNKFFCLRLGLLIPLVAVTAFLVVNDRMEDGVSMEDEVVIVQDEHNVHESSLVMPENNSDIDRNVDIRSFLEKGASIDRVRFLLFFLNETEGWKWWDYLLGSKPLTPLSQKTCDALSYWSDLYSFSGDGRCYSVILHSYIMRVIFDHGVLGLLFILLFTSWSLWRSGYKWHDILCVNGVLLASALSVSSFNSVFYPLSMILFYMVERPEARCDGRGYGSSVSSEYCLR